MDKQTRKLGLITRLGGLRLHWIGVVGVATAILSGAVLLKEYLRRQDLYWYDVGQGYEYRFTAPPAQRFEVQITSNGFVFPETNRKWDTALLKISVRATAAGKWFEPYVIVRHADGREGRQYFERGARGVRFVELGVSTTTVPPPGPVALMGHHLDWQEQVGELLLFTRPTTDSMPLLVLSPHPDDAELAAFGLYASKNSYVVTITNGSYPDAGYASFTEDAAAEDELNARLRVWDSLVVPQWAGVSPEQVFNLGYFALTLEKMYETPDAEIANPATGSTDVEQYRSWNNSLGVRDEAARPTWESLVADLVTLLRAVRPAIIVAPHPVLDRARDHVYTTVALFDALDEVAELDAHLFLYTNHNSLTDYYPFGPADSRVSLPPWFDANTPFTGILSLPLDRSQQVDKLFALDAMHDLRRKPHMEVGGVSSRILTRLRVAVAELWRDPAGEHSYFRRAVRPNELFFVYPPGDHAEIRAAADVERVKSVAQSRVGSLNGQSELGRGHILESPTN